MKGLRAPVEVYELVGAGPVRSRLQAAAVRGLTRFVGRDRELDDLAQALQSAGSGHGQVVALVGEAGVGKSRLVYEFVHSHRPQGWRVLEAASVSYGKATPYFPVLDLLKRYAQVEDRDDSRTIRAKVTGHVLTLDETLQETHAGPTGAPGRPARGQSVSAPGSAAAPPAHPRRLCKRLLLRESQVQPLLLVFEDLHWIDSETQALLDSLVEQPAHGAAPAPGQLPPGVSAWLGQQDLLHATAARPAAAGERGRSAPGAPGGRPQPGTAQAPADRAHRGQSLLSGGERADPGGDRGAGWRTGRLPPGASPPTLQVPATVQAVLAARIDRLPPEGLCTISPRFWRVIVQVGILHNKLGS